ncbi:YdcF family protein [Nostoc sp. FACHB-110]|uniref:YdcF family protein n=1 Tax=Nostoc sp. FACHB-110 TaxID=2692834 RepID=UPI001686B345|nr:YdcF family protein [Nostoc sp. FACHB-110]MBD2437137.1 YdcF family protein [Nostoc sp. FACHB-110]
MGIWVKLSTRQLKKYLILAAITFFLTLVLFIPIRLAIAFHQAPQPQAILMLGGTALGERETFTAEFARWYPSLEIWVSSGLTPIRTRQIFRASGIPDRRLHLDYRAVDTVTNFTTLVSDFKHRKIQHIYLITSQEHIPRARAIATIVLGSQGIAFTSLAVPSDQAKESVLSILRDIARSILWVFTGYTGASI